MDRKRVLLITLVPVLLLVLTGGYLAQHSLSLAQGPDPQTKPSRSEGGGPQASLGSGFTYQGRLKDSDGKPIDDSCDFTFSLWDAVSGGSQVGSDSVVTGVAVTDGYFAALVNGGGEFGASAFAGEARWLEIAVQCSSDSNPVTLSPRQALSAAPYTQYSMGAPWSGLSSVPAGFADNVDDDVLGGLSCANGQIAEWDGSNWICGDDDVGGGDFWSLSGNAGTTPGTNFVGTTDNKALELHVNSTCALRLEPNATTPNLIGGYSGNDVTGGVVGATIGGGGNMTGTNRVTDHYGTVGGGIGNQAGDNAGAVGDASYTTVGGGSSNSASGWGTTVGGGVNNSASGNNATVGGGWGNTASSSNATVGGGTSNTASRVEATVGGGENNTASGNDATVGGGEANTASGSYATVGGGYQNSASGDEATVGGGRFNEATAAYATIAGGGSNTADSGNRVTDDYGTVGGGGNNQAGNNAGTPQDAPYATVGGGYYNEASGACSTVGGGEANTASGSYATVGGGLSNEASGLRSTVGGGDNNTASGTYATVGGGYYNEASGKGATVPGGLSNLAQGDYSFAAGRRAKANHQGAFVWADSTNADFASFRADEFRVRATNGADFETNNAIYGLRVDNDGNGDGIRAYADVSATEQWAAVYAINSGTSPAVYANTNGTFSGYFMDQIYVQDGCVGCTLGYVGLNDGSDPLEAGDLVAVNGVGSPLVGTTTPLLRVRRADAANAGAAIGVVQSKATVVVSSKDGEQLEGANRAEGPAAPGEYLFIVVQGIADVKADATAGPIVPGQGLTAAEQPGHVRALRTPMPEGNVVGIALAPLAEGRSTIPVFITLGPSATSMGTADIDGASPVTIQGLYAQNQDLAAENAALWAENAAQQEQIDNLAVRVAALEATDGAAPTYPWQNSLLPGASILLVMMSLVWIARRRGGALSISTQLRASTGLRLSKGGGR